MDNSIVQEVQDTQEKIDEFDLTPVIERLIVVGRWKEKYAFKAIEQYRRFMYLQVKYGHTYILAPSEEIDEVWRVHILHTKYYRAFCDTLFGYYIHHYSELPNKQSSIKTVNAFKTTQALHYQEFGEYIYQIRPYIFREYLQPFFVIMYAPVKMTFSFFQH